MSFPSKYPPAVGSLNSTARERVRVRSARSDEVFQVDVITLDLGVESRRLQAEQRGCAHLTAARVQQRTLDEKYLEAAHLVVEINPAPNVGHDRRARKLQRLDRPQCL